MLVATTVLLGVATFLSVGAWIHARRIARAHEDAISAAIVELGSIPRPGDVDRSLREAIQRTAGDLDEQTDHARRFGDALATAPFGVMLVDPDGTLVFTNQDAERYVGGRHGDAVAEVQITTAIEETISRRTELMREIELYTPTRRVLGLHTVPLERNGRLSGVGVFLEDLTERHRVDAIRKDFVANASHELKTPLGALSILAETLADADDPDTRERLSDRLGVETRRMSRLIDDILDLAIVEGTGGERAPVSVDEVIEEAVKHVAVISEEFGVPIIVQPAGLDVVIRGDHRQLVSALSNLLENAIKYTQASGDPTRRPVEVYAAAEDGGAVIEITDHGIGISDQHLPRIFERFYRVDRARSRRTGGTGLGLAIVRHVVRNHDGTIEVASQPGEGSAFRLTLPLWSD